MTRFVELDEFKDWMDERNLLWPSQTYIGPEFRPKQIEYAWPWPRAYDFTRHWWLVDLIVAIIQASSLGKLGGWYLFPRHGRWTTYDKPYYRVRDAIIRRHGVRFNEDGLAVPGVIHFDAVEADDLAAAVYACCFFFDDCEGSAPDHFGFYPHHGQLGVWAYDEELFGVTAADWKPLERFNHQLGEAGWGWLRDEGENNLVWPSSLDWHLEGEESAEEL